ncbi:hypothetical protein SAMN05444714_2574 [Yoonia litorea]|uniref:Uncharacterized protein n=2 Tax=Yoonia litorea TaxID=1123755 RepID=A0A1I6MX66_9RHOB|nr:hypothetical protein SAMN05444714_2574 [Yoonia litorea]
MHPPFFHVDHKVDPPIRPAGADGILRRSHPAVLDLRVQSHLFAPVPMSAPELPEKVFADPPTSIQLRVVPAPRPTLRDRFGRLLIRLGQRIIFENHARRI